MLTNWKTTLAGVAAAVVALGDILHYASMQQVSPNLNADLAAFAAAVGLFAAHDAGKAS